MALERTFSIVKPDGVARNLIGQVYTRFEAAGLRIVAAEARCTCRRPRPRRSTPSTRRVRSSTTWSKYMTSGPVVLQVLEGENAVLEEPRDHGRHRSEEGRHRAPSAPTSPRASRRNTVHGSDSAENAAIEIAYFFAQTEIHAR